MKVYSTIASSRGSWPVTWCLFGRISSARSCAAITPSTCPVTMASTLVVARKVGCCLSDAWAWLQAHALIGLSPQNPPNVWQRVTATGMEVSNDPSALAKVWATDRLAGDLPSALSLARSNFALGDYETASFAAMKAVEVRRTAGSPNELVGVALMRKAFSPKDGVLRDPGAEGGEQQAIADLFVGAIGAYKNPASHRTVRFDDPVAAEVIQLADLLLRIVERAQVRLQD
jgi:uncharacterized protein (TIGR02391 family)